MRHRYLGLDRAAAIIIWLVAFMFTGTNYGWQVANVATLWAGVIGSLLLVSMNYRIHTWVEDILEERDQKEAENVGTVGSGGRIRQQQRQAPIHSD